MGRRPEDNAQKKWPHASDHLQQIVGGGSPSRSADPPDTMVLTYTFPSLSCWKKIPTPDAEPVLSEREARDAMLSMDE